MAATSKNKGGASRSPKKVKTAPAKAIVRPLLKKAPAKKAQPPKTASRTPAKPAKKAVPKKPAPAAKAKAVKKAALPPKPAPKAPAPAAAPKKDLVKNTVSKAPTTATKTVHKAAPAAEPKKPRFQKEDLDQFRTELLAMRDRITGQSGSMRSDALQRSDEVNPEEDGTDAFMRLQTLEQVSSQQQIIANIDESLRAIEKGVYGVCDSCGELINKSRLAVLPFAKNCIKCQSEMERQGRFGRK